MILPAAGLLVFRVIASGSPSSHPLLTFRGVFCQIIGVSITHLGVCFARGGRELSKHLLCGYCVML